jgi:uncharacterized protein (TIGR02271 family)
MTQSLADVTTSNGRKGSLDLAALKDAKARDLVCVQMNDGQQVWIVADSLVRQADGQYLLPIAVPKVSDSPDLEQGGATETTIIPVIVEQAVVTKRQVPSGKVRISKVVHEHEQTVHTTLTHQETDVIREPVGEFVNEAEQTRQEGDTLIVPVYEEVVVVEKRLRLRERLRITKRLVETEQVDQVVLRAEEAIVERVLPGASQPVVENPAK